MDPDPGTLTDNQLLLYVDWLADRRDSGAFDPAFEELSRRIREEAALYGQGDVEPEIARLRSMFRSRRGEDGPDAVGVREPRRPSPSAGGEAVALEPPNGYEEAA